MSDKYPGGFVTANAPAGFSVAFDGTGDRVDVASNAAFGVGTGDFTVEGWLYWVADGSNAPTVFSIGNVNSGGSLNIFVDGTYGLYVRLGTSDTRSTAAYNMLGKWIHFAAVRTSGVIALYYNGVSQAVTTSGASNSITATAPVIGWCAASAGNQGYLNGYISNLRYSNTAVYSANFTPPTQLFKTSSAILLACQSPTIIDNSNNAFALTPVGNTVVSNFTPFAAYQGFNPALGAAAGGVWTLDEAAYYQNNRQWPIYDPYFNQTTLMLHGNGTNGAQNNTFLDSSTNNFTITRNGNTTQGTFTPFSQTGWSNYFASASSQSLTVANNNAFKFSGQFTIELWVNPVAVNARIDMVCTPTSASSSTGVYFYIGSSGNPTFDQGGGNIVTSTATVAANTWTHLALTRNSSNLCTIWVNGVATGTATSAINFSDGNLYIGTENAATAYFNGYMSNVRILNGSALYTGNFTPSTQPLTAIPYTVLLTCQSNRFVDNSANNFTITPVNSPTVQAFSPFVPAYITPTTYSNWFNKSTGYLTVPSNTAFNFSTGDFTIEAWVWFNQTADASGGGQCVVSGTTAAYPVLYVSTNGGTTLSFAQNSSIIAGGTIQVRAWNHVAVSRSGTSLRFFVNGILAQTATYSTAIDFGGVYIGAQSVAGVIGFIDGAISNLRMLKGTALYTANFTPPTAPLTNITNTSLLTCQSSTLIDNSTANSGSAFTVTAVGGVYPVTSPTPFNPKVDQTTLNSAYSTSLIGGSYYGAATGDYLSFTDSSNLLDMGTTAASFECWYYMTATGAYQNIFLKYGGTAGWNATNGIEYGFAINNGVPTLSYFTGGTSLATLTDPTTRTVNQWYHFAIATDASNNISMYVNGVRVANATSAISKPTTRTTVNIGSTASQYVVGYLAGMRFLTGANAYNAASLNIGVPPLTPPTAVSGTQLLCNFTNGAIFDNTAKNVVETVGGITLSTTQAKYGNTSMSFNGTTGYLKGNANLSQNVAFGTGDFTIECWVYATSIAAGTSDTIIDARPGSNTGDSFLFYLWDGGKIAWYVPSVGGYVVNTGTVTANTWTHIAICRSGTTFRSFKDGVLQQTATNSTSYMNPGAPYPYIGGAYHLTGDFFRGYIDDLRITKGVARYLTNFTPPTSQLQDQ